MHNLDNEIQYNAKNKKYKACEIFLFDIHETFYNTYIYMCVYFSGK